MMVMLPGSETAPGNLVITMVPALSEAPPPKVLASNPLKVSALLPIFVKLPIPLITPPRESPPAAVSMLWAPLSTIGMSRLCTLTELLTMAPELKVSVVSKLLITKAAALLLKVSPLKV